MERERLHEVYFMWDGFGSFDLIRYVYFLCINLTLITDVD